MNALVAEKLIDGVDVILGMNAINGFGGVAVAEGRILFGKVRCSVISGDSGGSAVASACGDESVLVMASFDGRNWTV